MIDNRESGEPNGVPDGLLESFKDKPREFEVVHAEVEGGVWLDSSSKDSLGTYAVNVTNNPQVKEELKRLGHDVDKPEEKITGVLDSYEIGSDGIVRATRNVQRHPEAYQSSSPLAPILPIDITPKGLTLGHITEQPKTFSDQRGTMNVRTLHLITARPKLPPQTAV